MESTTLETITEVEDEAFRLEASKVHSPVTSTQDALVAMDCTPLDAETTLQEDSTMAEVNWPDTVLAVESSSSSENEMEFEQDSNNITVAKPKKSRGSLKRGDDKSPETSSISDSAFDGMKLMDDSLDNMDASGGVSANAILDLAVELERKNDPDLLYLHANYKPLTNFATHLKGKFTIPYEIDTFVVSDLKKALDQQHYSGYSEEYKKYVDKREYSKVKTRLIGYLRDRRKLLIKPPNISINDRIEKEKIFLSGLIYLHEFNNKFHPRQQFRCPCSSFHRRWLNIFCKFKDEIPVCADKTMTLEQLSTHLKDKARTCRWHRLIQEFMTKVFQEQARHRKNLTEEKARKKHLFLPDKDTMDEDGDRKLSEEFYDILKKQDKQKYLKNELTLSPTVMKENIPCVLTRPYLMSTFEGLSLERSLELQCPMLDIGYYIDYMTYDSLFYYDKYYDHYVERRRHYLCDYENFIQIDERDNKDKLFLSGLVYLTTFTDKFATKVWCPCSVWNRTWLYRFCPFHEEILVCKAVHTIGPLELEEMHAHVDEMKLQCRWHNLIYEFMLKVFFNDDNFLPKDCAHIE